MRIREDLFLNEGLRDEECFSQMDRVGLSVLLGYARHGPCFKACSSDDITLQKFHKSTLSYFRKYFAGISPCGFKAAVA